MGSLGTVALSLFGVFLLVVLIAVAVRWGVLLALDSALRSGSATRKQIAELLQEGRRGEAAEPHPKGPSKYL